MDSKSQNNTNLLQNKNKAFFNVLKTFIFFFIVFANVFSIFTKFSSFNNVYKSKPFFWEFFYCENMKWSKLPWTTLACRKKKKCRFCTQLFWRHILVLRGSTISEHSQNSLFLTSFHTFHQKETIKNYNKLSNGL